MKQGKCLDPKTLRQVCSLLLSDANKTAVQRKIGVSRITAANIWQRMMKADITSFQSLNRLDDTSLLNACYPHKSVWTAADDGIPQSLQVSSDGPDFKALALDKIHSHKHIQLYYFDYFEKCREGKTEALSRSQFYLRFKQALDALKAESPEPTFILQKNYGESCEIDYGGTTLTVTMDDGSREELVVMGVVWSASGYLFANFIRSRTTAESSTVIGKAFKAFGCAPVEIIPDNAACWVDDHAYASEPVINESFEHYLAQFNVFVRPTGIRAPTEKSRIEYSIRLLSERVLPRYPTDIPATLEEHNLRLMELVDKYINKAPYLEDEERTREYLFLEYEKPQAQTLPAVIPTYAEVRQIKVPRNYHIEIYGHKYSVPFSYIGYIITVKIYTDTIKCYCRNRLIAVHSRCYDSDKRIITLQEHMPEEHKAVKNSRKYKTLDDVLNAARECGENIYNYCVFKSKHAAKNNRLKACAAAVNFYQSCRNRDFADEAFARIFAEPSYHRNLSTLYEIYRDITDEFMLTNKVKHQTSLAFASSPQEVESLPNGLSLSEQGVLRNNRAHKNTL